MEKPRAPNGQSVNFDKESKVYTFVDNDNVEFEYDSYRKAWFPRMNQFESQQAAYGTCDVSEEEPKVTRKRKKIYTMEAESKESAKAKETEKLKMNTCVFVQGLPDDACKEEIAEFFQKCGVLMEDTKGCPKIKMYSNDGMFSGNALVTYFKEESVDLAVQLLDGNLFRPEDSNTLGVKKAEFKEKEQPQKKKKLSQDEKKRIKVKIEELQKKLEWQDEDEEVDEKWSRIAILLNIFKPDDFVKDPVLYLDLKDDIRKECQKLGEVTNKSVEGAVSVKFKESWSAELCVKRMNGRFYGGRKIVALICSGKITYARNSKKDTENALEEELKRLENYSDWIENN